MIYDLVLLLGVALLVATIFLYPWIQQRREDEIARRLEGISDPKLAMMQLDSTMDKSRNESGFFRKATEAFFRLWYLGR